MPRRSILLLTGFLLLVLLAAYYLDGTRRSVRIMTERSIPAVRILGDLRDLLSRVQIGLLEKQSLGVPITPQEAQARRQQLDQAAELLQRYRETIVSPQGQELSERANLTLGDYRVQAEELFQVEVAAADATEELRQCVLVYRRLQQDLTELRNDRLGRVETRISEVDRRTSRLLHTNFVALGALVLAIIISWFGSRVTSHDLHLF